MSLYTSAATNHIGKEALDAMTELEPIPPPASSRRLCIHIPIKVHCRLNARGCWQKAHKINALERTTMYLLFQSALNGLADYGNSLKAATAIKVKFTRYYNRAVPQKKNGAGLAALHGGKPLDEGDNLSSAFKAIRDELAAVIGINDASRVYSWEYAQEKSTKHGCRVELEW